MSNRAVIHASDAPQAGQERAEGSTVAVQEGQANMARPGL